MSLWKAIRIKDLSCHWKSGPEIVRSIKYVDEVTSTNTLDKKEIWDKIRFDEIYIGDDWKGNERWERTGKEMEALGARLVYLPYTKDTSSTMLREKLKEY